MMFLERADFEHACAGAGINDLEREGDGYANPATQATYQVWLSAAKPLGDAGAKPVAWATRRANRVHGICHTRPPGPGADDWALKMRQGWQAPMALFVNVPAASPTAMAMVMERQRQLTMEGYGLDWDQQYQHNELIRAAACYVLQAAGIQSIMFKRVWPWPNAPLKRCDAAESITKAVALLIADRERHQGASA
jgi:hypothetical protein